MCAMLDDTVEVWLSYKPMITGFHVCLLSVYILAHYTLVQILTREESTLWGVCSMCLILNMLVLDRQVLSFEIASFTCQTVNLDCVSLWDGYDLGLNRLNRLGSLEVLLLWWLVLVGLLGDKQRQVWECDGEGETRALECLNMMFYVYLMCLFAWNEVTMRFWWFVGKTRKSVHLRWLKMKLWALDGILQLEDEYWSLLGWYEDSRVKGVWKNKVQGPFGT